MNIQKKVLWSRGIVLALVVLATLAFVACGGGGAPTSPSPGGATGGAIQWTTLASPLQATPDPATPRQTVEFKGLLNEKQDNITQHVKWVMKGSDGKETVLTEYDQPTRAFSGTTLISYSIAAPITAGAYMVTCSIKETMGGQENSFSSSATFQVK